MAAKQPEKSARFRLLCEGALPLFHFTLKAFWLSSFRLFVRQARRRHYPVLLPQERTFVSPVLPPSQPRGGSLQKTRQTTLSLLGNLFSLLYSFSMKKARKLFLFDKQIFNAVLFQRRLHHRRVINPFQQQVVYNNVLHLFRFKLITANAKQKFRFLFGEMRSERH